MKEKNFVIGFGELVFDHIFCDLDGSLVYQGSRGGGSVFNTLVNLAHHQVSVMAAGVGGSDVFGHDALNDLKYGGVDVSKLSMLRGKATRIINEISFNALNERTNCFHRFSVDCPICQRRADDRRLARLQNFNLYELNISSIRFACFDRVTKERVKLARTLRDFGVDTVLDLGRISYLRYLPVAQLIAGLGAFQILFLSKSVAESIVKRAGFSDIQDLLLVGPSKIMCVTDGKNGLQLYTRSSETNHQSYFAPPLMYSVKDDAGAGDALLANLLQQLGIHSRKIQWTHDTVEAAAMRAILDLKRKLRSLGARGHLPNSYENSLKSWIGKSVNSIRENIDRALPCLFCGTGPDQFGPPIAVQQSSARGGSKRVISLLLRRTFLALEQHEAIDSCKLLTQQAGTAFAVGTGGSYPVAVFLSILLGKHSNLFVQPIRPFDYIRSAPKTNYLFIISYSGSTVDCAEAIQRGRDLGVEKIVLLTRSPHPKLGNLLDADRGDVLISYGRSKAGKGLVMERGFVSIAGTVAPCALWTAAIKGSLSMAHLAQELDLLDSEVFRNDARKITECLKKIPDSTVAVFGGGLAWPAMYDIESKFVEGGIGNIQLHEVKDFSHGRFISVLAPERRDNPFIFLCVGQLHPYEEQLLQSLPKHSYVLIRSKHSELVGSLELLIRIQFFVQACGEMLGKDISRPSHLPQAGLKLYKWDRGLRVIE